MKLPSVYIMANKRKGTLYAGVTSNLPQRAWQHREGAIDGFTKLALIAAMNLMWRDLFEDIAHG